MGEVFKYIADDILERKGVIGNCPLCREQTRVYPYPNDVSDPEAPTDYVDEACSSCIRQVQFDFWDEKTIRGHVQSMINSHFPKGTLSGVEREQRLNTILGEYLRTPRLPTFLQGDDWPHCCGDYTEYVGEPKSSRLGDLDHYEYWDHGPCENPNSDSIYDLIPKERLAVLGGVSGFRCNKCKRHFWTFQCT